MVFHVREMLLSTQATIFWKLSAVLSGCSVKITEDLLDSLPKETLPYPFVPNPVSVSLFPSSREFYYIWSMMVLKRLFCVWNLPDQLGSSHFYLGVVTASRFPEVGEVDRNSFAVQKPLYRQMSNLRVGKIFTLCNSHTMMGGIPEISLWIVLCYGGEFCLYSYFFIFFALSDSDSKINALDQEV